MPESAPRPGAPVIEILESPLAPISEWEPLAQACTVRVNGLPIETIGVVTVHAGFETLPVRRSSPVLVVVDALCALPKPATSVEEAVALAIPPQVDGKTLVEFFYDPGRLQEPLRLRAGDVFPACTGARVGNHLVHVVDAGEYPLLITRAPDADSGELWMRVPFLTRRVILDAEPPQVGG